MHFYKVTNEAKFKSFQTYIAANLHISLKIGKVLKSLWNSISKRAPQPNLVLFESMISDQGKILIWFFYWNKLDLYNQHKQADLQISWKTPWDILNYPLYCSCRINLISFWLNKAAIVTSTNFFFFSNDGHLGWSAMVSITFFKRGPPKDHPSPILFHSIHLNVIFF